MQLFLYFNENKKTKYIAALSIVEYTGVHCHCTSSEISLVTKIVHNSAHFTWTKVKSSRYSLSSTENGSGGVESDNLRNSPDIQL